jgi:hypothetical protein
MPEFAILFRILEKILSDSQMRQTAKNIAQTIVAEPDGTEIACQKMIEFMI